MMRMTMLLLALLALLVLASLASGDYAVAWRDLFSLILRPAQADPQLWLIVVDLRLTRVLMALLVGAALGVAGSITQSIMRNPLAEPGILGINSGAALAATIFIVFFKDASPRLLPWAGFVGALLAAFTVYLLSWKNGASSLRIVLVGIGIGAVVGAATTLLTTFAPIGDAQRALIWLSGSVYLADWTNVRQLALWLVLPLGLSLFAARELDLIRFGDVVARSIGQRVELVRAGLIVLCALICGAAVAAAGPIGFVGLIAPHIARRLVGPNHARLLPVAALVGAILVVAADLFGRTIIAPAQLPAGLVTALIGAPFFAWLLWGRRHAAT